MTDRVFALKDDASDESPGGVRWRWSRMAMDDWADAYCLTSAVASYDLRLGLLLEPSGEALPPIRYRGRAVGPRLHYRRETYHDHVGRVLRQALAWLERHPIAVERCADRYRIGTGLVRAELLLAAGLHDAAKLDEGWQRAVGAWQAFKSGRTEDDLLAHTDYDPATDGEAQRRPEFRRPNHAVEGALAVLTLVDGWLADLGCVDEVAGDCLRRIVVSAIARHHSPNASKHGPFRLVLGANDSLLAPFLCVPELAMPTLESVVFSPSGEDCQVFEQYAFLDPQLPSHAPYWPLYSFVVRGLRLSDQSATREGTDAADAAKGAA